VRLVTVTVYFRQPTSSAPRTVSDVKADVQLVSPGSRLDLVTLLAENLPAKLTVSLVLADVEVLLVPLMSVRVTARLNGTLENESGEASAVLLLVVRL